MNNTLATLILIFLTSNAFSQEVTLNDKAGFYEYEEVFEYQGAKQSQIQKALLSLIPKKEAITFQDEEKIVVNHPVHISGYKFLFMSETFRFKDGAMKWTVSDLNYLYKATATSKPQPINELEGKTKKKVLEWTNENLRESKQYLVQKMVIEDGTKNDW